MAKSPSITIIEKDMSTYTVTNSSTVLAVVGYAAKGPIGEPVKVTSKQEFLQRFGGAVAGSPYSFLAVSRAFRQGNQIVFYRVADDSAKAAEVIITNPIAASAGYQDINIANSQLTGLIGSTNYNLNISVNGGTPIPVVISTDTAETTKEVTQIGSAIALALTAASSKATVSTGNSYVRISSGTTGVDSKITISAGATNDFLSLTGVSLGTAVAGAGAKVDVTDKIKFKSKEKGSATNLIAVRKSSSVNALTTAVTHTVEVLYDEVVVETFNDVSLNVSDSNFFAKKINADVDNGGSEYVIVDYNESSADADTLVSFPDNVEEEVYQLGTGVDAFQDGDSYIDGSYDHVVGTDGYTAATTPEIKNNNIDMFIKALSVTGELANTDEYDYHILITPDMPDVAVQNAAISLAEFRKDFLYIVDPPFGYTYSQVANWHNGKFGDRQSAINTSYAAMYWSWLKDYDESTKEYIWCPPSVFMAEKLMEIDNSYGPWYAPAGDSRGRLNAADYEASPSFAQREVLYNDVNCVNPIVNFTSKGLVIYGQKTLYRENSALNRVNVRRMAIYAKKLIKKAMDSIVFEPHNPDSWRRATNLINSILEPIKVGGGLENYKVVIDSTVNTPDVIAQNIMKGIIKLIPTGTIEIIELTLQFNKSGASLD